MGLLAAAAGAASTAHAQSNVSIYGIADGGVVFENGNPRGSTTKVGSGISAGSRLGFRGSEDLGGGLTANFVMETGFNLDNGGFAQGVSFTGNQGLIFGRQSHVGLKGGFGSVSFGRQYNPYFLTLNFVDPYATGQVGQSNNLMTTTGSGGRTNNSILYISPKFAGVGVELLYGFGEVAGDNARSRVINGALSYASGPLVLRLAHQHQNNASATVAAAKNTILGGTYDFGIAKLHAAFAVNKGPGSTTINAQATGFNLGNGTPYTALPGVASTDARDLLVGTTVPVTGGRVLASYIRRNDRTALNQDANQFSVGYEHNLSKRTILYTAYARISNSNGAAYTVGNSGDASGGSGDRAISLGVRHHF